jgi:hypothetical protein
MTEREKDIYMCVCVRERERVCVREIKIQKEGKGRR